MEAHRELGRLLLRNRQPEDGLAHLRCVAELRPDLPEAREELGAALLELGQAEHALVELQSAVQLAPNSATARANLGSALLRTGRPDEALAQDQAAVELEPANAYLLNNFAWLLATCPKASVRNGARAVESAQKAERLTGGKDAWVLGTLAAAYAEAGRFADAISAAQRALELAASQSNTVQVATLRAHIRLYQAGTAVRDPARTKAAAAPER